MLDGSIDGSDPGLLNLAAGFDSLASFAPAGSRLCTWT